MAQSMIESLMNDGFIDPATGMPTPEAALPAPAPAAPIGMFSPAVQDIDPWGRWTSTGSNEYGDPTGYVDDVGNEISAWDLQQLQQNALRNSVDPWERALMMRRSNIYDPASSPMRHAAAIDFAEALGIDPELAAQLYTQGMQNNVGSDFFAGATDRNNRNLMPAWGMLEIARQSGAINNPLVADWLRNFADVGNTEKDIYNAQESATSKAKLGQFVGMLGGMAFSPMAFGGSEWLGQLGGKLAGGAAGMLGTAIGGGNPLTAAVGMLGGAIDLPDVFSGLGATGSKVADSLVRSIGTGALQQLTSGRGIDVAQLALGAVPGVADTVWSDAGGWSGLFGGEGGADSGWTSGYDLPMGQIEPAFSGGGYSPVPQDPNAFNFSPSRITTDNALGGNTLTGIDTRTGGLFSTTRELADPLGVGATNYVDPNVARDTLTASGFADSAGMLGDTLGLAAPVMQMRGMAAPAPQDAPTAEPIDFTVNEVQDPTPEDTQDDLFMPEDPAAQKPWYDSIKPSTILSIGMKLAALLGAKDAFTTEADSIVNAQYADDTARRNAYLDYANRVLGAIPEIGDAYRPDFFAENSQMGRVEIDPETGEARYVLSAEGQQAVDDMLSAADKVVNQILETDATKLSEEEFTKKVEALRGKRDADLAKLLRVLYARGMLGVATYGEAFENPLTGRMEAYDLQEGQDANPYLAAYQSAVERENADLAGKSMTDAQDFIDSLLNESTDLTNQIGGTSGTMLDAILGARGRYGANVEAGQARGNALAQLLESPAALFGDRVGAEDLLASLTRKPNLSDDERRRLLMMMGGQ